VNSASAKLFRRDLSELVDVPNVGITMPDLGISVNGCSTALPLFTGSDCSQTERCVDAVFVSSWSGLRIAPSEFVRKVVECVLDDGTFVRDVNTVTGSEWYRATIRIHLSLVVQVHNNNRQVELHSQVNLPTDELPQILGALTYQY
jgi:hypothetical protein